VEYQRKLLDACVGKVEFTKSRTLGKTETETYNIYHDIHATTTEQTYDVTLSTWQ